MEDDLIEGLVVEGVSENVKKDMIALLKEPAKFFYPLEAVKWWASRGYFRDEEAKAQALRWIKVRLQEAMKNEEIDSLPELSGIFSSRAPLEKRWTILKFLSEARRQDRNPARMIPLWFKRGYFKNRSVKNVILGYLCKGLVLPEEDEAEPEPDEDVPDTDYDKDDTASSPVGGPWQNSRDAMLEYEIAKVREILRIRMGSFLGQFVFDELHHHGILEEMFDEIIQQLRPWEVQLLWDLREEMFGPHEMGEVIYEIVAQEIGFSMSRIVRMVFDRSARVESIVKILREVAAIIIEQGANVFSHSDITGFMETLKEIHREAKEEENITRSLFVSKMRHVYKGLRPMEEESLKEQALEKLFFDYTERIRLHVNEKREKGEAISFVPSSGREGGASSSRSPLGEAEGPRRGSSPVEFPEPFEINDEEGNLLTAHIGDITFRKSTHAVYLRENFVGKFEFEKESQGGVPWFVLSRVRIKPFWRGQGIAGQLIPWLVKKALREDAKVKIANIVNPLMVVMAQRLLSDIQAMVVVPPGELLAMETFSPVELFYLGGVVGEVGIRKGVITGSRMQDGYTVSIEGGRLNLLRQEGGIQEGPLHFMASGRRPLSGVNLGTLFGSAEIVDDRWLMRGLLYFNEDGSLDLRRSRWEENFSIEVRGFHIRAMDGQGKIYQLWRVSPRSVNLLGTPTQGHGGDQPSSSPVRNVNNSGSSASMPPVRRPAKEAGIDLWTVTKIETGEISRPTLQATARPAAGAGGGATAYGEERAFRDLMVRRKRLWLKRIRGEEIEIKPGEENGLTEDYLETEIEEIYRFVRGGKEKTIYPKDIIENLGEHLLSAFAEDHGLCPWMSALLRRARSRQKILIFGGNAKEFLLRRDVRRRAKPLVNRRRITPTSVTKLSFHLATSYSEKANEKRISSHLIPRNFSLRNFRDFTPEIAVRFLGASRGNPGTTGFARGAPLIKTPREVVRAVQILVLRGYPLEVKIISDIHTAIRLSEDIEEIQKKFRIEHASSPVAYSWQGVIPDRKS